VAAGVHAISHDFLPYTDPRAPVRRDVRKVIQRRGKKGLFTHIRRVPKRFADVDARRHVFTALHTDDAQLARIKARDVERLQDTAWEARLAGHDEDATRLWDALRELAARRGFLYRPVPVLAAGSLEELVARVEAVQREPAGTRATVADALLGRAPEPAIPVSGLLVRVEALTPDRRRGMDPGQVRRWRNQRAKAARNFVAAVGDRPIDKITRADALAFRAWWWDRIEAEELNPKTANKDLTMMGSMLAVVRGLEGSDAANPFHRLRFEEQEADKLPFSAAWIRDVVLAPGALDGLNAEARAILHVLIGTGARPSEIVALDRGHISLDHAVPHISIAPVGRRTKTELSRRDVPLLGVALDALTRHPAGFPRYRGKATHWSNAAAKFMRENGLLETPRHRPYGFRHAISDALQNADCPDRTRKEILGHAIEGMAYGRGATLETKRGWLARVVSGEPA
jgi:integrase